MKRKSTIKIFLCNKIKLLKYFDSKKLTNIFEINTKNHFRNSLTINFYCNYLLCLFHHQYLVSYLLYNFYYFCLSLNYNDSSELYYFSLNLLHYYFVYKNHIFHYYIFIQAHFFHFLLKSYI